MDPQHAWAYNNRGHVYSDKGNRQQALADSEMCLALGVTGTRKEDVEEMIGTLQ